jgi:hypothetical protein
MPLSLYPEDSVGPRGGMDSRSMKSLDLVEKRTANPRPSSLYPINSQARYIEYMSVRRFAAINLLIHQPKSVHCRHVAVDASSYKWDHEVVPIHKREGHLLCSRYCTLDPHQRSQRECVLRATGKPLWKLSLQMGVLKFFR